MPAIESAAGCIRVFAGTHQGKTSPAVHFSEIDGADLQVSAGHTLTLPVRPNFEHALLVLRGDATLADQPLRERVLYYLGTTRSAAAMSSGVRCGRRSRCS